MKYTDTQIVFRELPDEITLAINISGCPLQCKGCHSPYLREDIGTILTKEVLKQLITDNPGITAICFMGGDAQPIEINVMAKWLKKHYSSLNIGWYSGRKELSHDIELQNFNYIKLGPYIPTLGGLDSPHTNQHLYEVVMTREVDINDVPIYGFNDITHKLQKSI